MANLATIAQAIMAGKTDAAGLVTQALKEGVTAEAIVSQAIETGVEALAGKFRRNEIYMPDVLLAKRAVKGCMAALGDRVTAEVGEKVGRRFDELQRSCKCCGTHDERSEPGATSWAPTMKS